jgi:molybdenum cofactor cytidylyltransferase
VTPGEGELAAVILAGGASSRMGSPKALLRYHGETFVDRLVRLFAARCERVIVVLGHDAQTVTRGMERSGEAVLVLNPRPELGQFSSLQAGLRAAGSNARAVFFHPVDIPAIQPETVARLSAAWDESPARALVLKAAHQGRTGHPVLIAAAVAEHLLALPPESNTREALKPYSSRDVEVDDAGIHGDTDTPEDYGRLVSGVAPE